MKADQISCNGKIYLISPETRKMTVPIDLTNTDEVSVQWEVPQDAILRHVTAFCPDSEGLRAFRCGWKNDSRQNRDFWSYASAADVIYPIASQVFTDASSPVNLPEWNVVFLTGTYRSFVAQDYQGTLPYTVELTLWWNLLIEISGEQARARYQARARFLAELGEQISELVAMPMDAKG